MRSAAGQPQQCLPDEENYGPRPKAVLLTLGWITLRRPYLYSALRGEGRFPLDSALGLVDSYSPEVLRWLCRAAALAGSYQAASQDLLTYCRFRDRCSPNPASGQASSPGHESLASGSRADRQPHGRRYFVCGH